MSRIGKHPVVLPTSVQVSLNNSVLLVKGPKGEFTFPVHPSTSVVVDSSAIVVSISDTQCKTARSMWGTSRSIIANLVHGVSEGYSKVINLVGVGYKAVVKDGILVLSLGYSHDIWYALPSGITATVDKNAITFSGADKQLLGEVCAKIKSLRKENPYKGKGLYEEGQYIRRKESKRKK